MPSTLQFNAIDVAVNKARAPGVFNGVIERNAYFKILQEMGRMTAWRSGTEFQIPFRYGDSTLNNVMTFSGWDSIDSTPQPDPDALQFGLKHYVSSFSVSLVDKLAYHKSADMIIDVKAERMADAEDRLENKLSQDAITGGASGTNIIGLATFINTAPTSGTNGGVVRTVAVNQNLYRRSSVDYSAAMSSSNALYQINKTVATILNRKNRFLMAADGNAYSYIHAAIEPRAQMVSSDKGFLGFAGFDYAFGSASGKLALIGGVGSVVSSDRLYIVNPENVDFRYHPESNFTLQPEVSYIDQLGQTSRITWSGSIGMTLKDQAVLRTD
jgi:hypothetical protein